MPVATMSSCHDRPRVTGSEHEYGTCNKIASCKINSLCHALYGYLTLRYWSSNDRHLITQWLNGNIPYVLYSWFFKVQINMNAQFFQQFYFHKLD